MNDDRPSSSPAAARPSARSAARSRTSPRSSWARSRCARPCARAGVRPDQVDEVVLGCILQAGLGMNPARQATIKAGLPGVGAGPHREQGLRLGAEGGDAGRAGDQVRRRRDRGRGRHGEHEPRAVPAARRALGRAAGPRPASLDHMIHEGLTDAFHDIHMGITAENLVERYGISPRGPGRVRGARARPARRRRSSEGRFKDEIVAVPVPRQEGRPTLVDTDEHPRAGHHGGVAGASSSPPSRTAAR